MWAKQSTAATLIVGPILDSAGVEYTGAVIGDLTITKNGTSAAMAAAATLTHVENGLYSLVFTTGNTDTLGRLQVSCNKSGYQMPPVNLMVVPATVFDALVTNELTATGGLGPAVAESVGTRVPGQSGNRDYDYFVQGGPPEIEFSADGLSLTVYSVSGAVLTAPTATRLATTVGGLRSLTIAGTGT